MINKESVQKLTDTLDRELAAIIAKCKETTDLDPISFTGTVAGFLVKTGILIAVRDGCPNKVLREQLNTTITEAYKKKGKL